MMSIIVSSAVDLIGQIVIQSFVSLPGCEGTGTKCGLRILRPAGNGSANPIRVHLILFRI